MSLVKVEEIDKIASSRLYDFIDATIETNIVDKDKLKSKSKNTPIENRKLQGQVLKTFVKGELAYENI